MIFLLIIISIVLVILTEAKINLFQVIAIFFSNLWWRILILMYIKPQLITYVIIILIRIIYTMYDTESLSEMFVLFYDSPGNTSGNTSGAQDINTNYLYTEEGQRPYLADNKIRFTQDKVTSANEHVTPSYVREFKIKLLNAAYEVSTPGVRGITLSEALILTNSSNGDAALIRGHCENQVISDVTVITKGGIPGKFFRDLDN